VALIKGAARGIGTATAVRLGHDGWDLVLVDLPPQLEGISDRLGTLFEVDPAVSNCLTRTDCAVQLSSGAVADRIPGSAPASAGSCL
jgi:NAD(P)-dependent dehydrogenase (short-subunit alcohol dehydrogenase family)